MSETHHAPTGESCPVCGSPLVTGTLDFADVPDETSDIDEPRRELIAGEMVQVTACSNPDCPGPGALGAEL